MTDAEALEHMRRDRNEAMALAAREQGRADRLQEELTAALTDAADKGVWLRATEQARDALCQVMIEMGVANRGLHAQLAEAVKLLRNGMAGGAIATEKVRAFLARYDEPLERPGFLAGDDEGDDEGDGEFRASCTRVFVGIGPCVGVKGHGGKCDPVRLKP